MCRPGGEEEGRVGRLQVEGEAADHLGQAGHHRRDGGADDPALEAVLSTYCPSTPSRPRSWYIVETQRVPPSLEWTKLSTDCKEAELDVKYSSNKDYYFRVKAANEFGVAEPSMPAMLRKKEGRQSVGCFKIDLF